MSDEKKETSADIIAEMRDAAMNGEYDEHTINDWADRLEAAAKREKAQHGNAAAMKEALTKIHDLTNALDEECAVDPVEIRDIARNALASLPTELFMMKEKARKERIERWQQKMM